ncbi:MAG: thiamine-phosphate kinase [Candidatus Omnitrophica bacterium]|nr:thiamine-phosphate kinase [Candidatus Omnitrophota bacterium]
MKKMTEAGLIDWIRKASPADSRVLVGIGDDAAVVRGSAQMAFKTDMIIENVHFERRGSRPEDWGYKAAAVNLSDMAAMGAKPEYALAAVGLPADMSPNCARAIHRGMMRALGAFGVALVGGDTCRSERITIAVFMAGSINRGKMFLRSGGSSGDVLFVTGKLGGSLRFGRHLRFVPRIRESEYLAKHYQVRAMMDISDGLAKDLRLLGAESGTGAELETARIPVHSDAGRRGVSAALLDGEDFELLFALKDVQARRLERDRAAGRLGMRFYRIGRLVPKKQGFTLIGTDGTRQNIPPAPDHHFGS